jgi:hypothetical protein
MTYWNLDYKIVWYDFLLRPELIVFSIINIILLLYFYNNAVTKNGGLEGGKRLLARNDLFLLGLLGAAPFIILAIMLLHVVSQLR